MLRCFKPPELWAIPKVQGALSCCLGALVLATNHRTMRTMAGMRRHAQQFSMRRHARHARDALKALLNGFEGLWQR